MTSRIVLADDDPELREILTTYLKMRWDVKAFNNGKDALDEVLRERPALVILDIVMPRMNGLDVVEALRANPGTADVPILMMTASTRGSDTHDAVWKMAANTDAFITKPFDPQALMAKAEQLITAAVRRARPRT